MPDIPESLGWVEEILALRAYLEKNSSPSRLELKTVLKLTNTKLTYARSLNACFDTAAIEKVRQAAQGPRPYTLTYNSALALAGLKGKGADTFHPALDVVLARQLPPRHIKALVDWVASGKPASEFDTKAKPKPAHADSHNTGESAQPSHVARHVASQQATHQDAKEDNSGEYKKEPVQLASKGLDLDKLVELAKKAGQEEAAPYDEASGARQGKYQDELKAYLDSLKLESEKLGVKSTAKPHASTQASAGDLSLAEKLFWDFMAGIPIYRQIDSKLKKGENPTSGEKFLLVCHVIGKGLGAALKIAGKIVKKIWKEGWKLLKKLFKGKSFWGKTVTAALLLIVVFWLVPSLFDHWVVYPLLHFKSKFFHADSQQTPAAISPNITANPNPAPRREDSSHRSEESVAKETFLSKPEKQSAIPAPTIAYAPMHSFNPVADTHEDQKYLEAEMAALPLYCRVKNFAFDPNTAMGAEMADNRLADLADGDKYSLRVGQNAQKVTSVVPTSTNLTLTYQGDSFDSLLGGSKKIYFYWEDVKSIHFNEIEVSDNSLVYQCSVVATGLKQPLIVQCASAGDLEHLVWAMEYFIKSAPSPQKASGISPPLGAQLASMPYLNQGMRLDDKGVITAVWDDSPADRTDLKMKDVLWSLDTNASKPQTTEYLEAGLQSLTAQAGGHKIYYVTPSDWTKASDAIKGAGNGGINPVRHTVSLLVD